MLLQAIAGQPSWMARRVFPRLEGYPSEADCWLWQGSLDKGYGKVHVPRVIEGSSVVPVHRLVWLALVGPIAEGLVLDHDGPAGCHNRACSNPAHLQAVTNRHNLVVTGTGFPAVNAAKTHCLRGHALVGDNLAHGALLIGYRHCMECARVRDTQRTMAVRRAARSLGLTWTQFVRAYGKSTSVALTILGEV